MSSCAGPARDLLEAAQAGDRRALARAITLVESGDPAAGRAARRAPRPDGARVIALTGPPGVGKSFLVDALLPVFLERGRRVAVLAVDPTSPRTGGALLGDRARITTDDGEVFFRSMAAREGRSGLAPEVPAVLRLLALAGFERILLETAGVGQGEHAVTRVADLTAALIAPGLGDRVQAAKAGLFEVADLVVVTQGDRSGAEATALLWKTMRAPGAGPVLLTSARNGAGLEALVDELERQLAGRRAASALAAVVEDSAVEDPGAGIRLHHVGIATRDANAAAALWGDLLGLRESARYEVREYGVLAVFLQPDPARGGERGAGGRIELLEPLDPEGPVARFLDRRGEGMHHVCFEVADLARAVEDLAARDVRLVDRAPRRGAGGHFVAFLHPAAAGGVLLELKQAPNSDAAPGRPR